VPSNTTLVRNLFFPRVAATGVAIAAGIPLMAKVPLAANSPAPYRNLRREVSGSRPKALDKTSHIAFPLSGLVEPIDNWCRRKFFPSPGHNVPVLTLSLFSRSSNARRVWPGGHCLDYRWLGIASGA
jgi:hypothetical protein